MTVQTLYRELGKLIAAGKGRSPVCVDKPTFSHNCEGDGCVILNVVDVLDTHVLQIDDDGGAKINKDGTESFRRCAVLVGDAWEPQARKEPRRG